MTELSSSVNRSPVPPARQLTAEMLAGPIALVMLRLALPTVAVLVVQTFVGVMETYFVSSLGADVLAGVAVVFPVLMLMQMMANGGIGGGLASAVARASGAGRWGDAQALVWHGVVIAGVMGGAIAGYGIASRLDYLQVPLLFGLGTAIMPMVGVNLGAGQVQRAQRIAWIGTAIAFAFTEFIGLSVAAFPQIWLTIFSDEQQVLAAGASYLRNVAPFYGAIGVGMALYFAGQGAKRVLWPVLAGTARMIIAALVGWLAVTHFDVGLPSLFQIVALSAFVYGAITVAATLAVGRANRLAMTTGA